MEFPDALELPCGDAPFCPPCRRKWLLEFGSNCPLCQQPADPCAFEDQKQKKKKKSRPALEQVAIGVEAQCQAAPDKHMAFCVKP
eukprot:12402329-Karenia_brevis.AAC.1